MKIVHIETLISCGEFANSKEWTDVRAELHAEIRKVVWPKGSDKFTIYPQSGKKRGEGNGVTPIKEGLILKLQSHGWIPEQPIPLDGNGRKPGKLDAVKHVGKNFVALEWETGNISSSHRAVNKMALGMIAGKLCAGTLVLPTRKMYKFLTDRIGNYEELSPYFPVWKHLEVDGVLEIVAIEHDAESIDVPRIAKGTDGRALA